MRSGQFYAQPSEQVVGRGAGTERGGRREGRVKRKRAAGWTGEERTGEEERWRETKLRVEEEEEEEVEGEREDEE